MGSDSGDLWFFAPGTKDQLPEDSGITELCYHRTVLSTPCEIPTTHHFQ